MYRKKGDVMVYLNHFVAVLKVDGKILREKGDIVSLPFGKEYNILLKNLESRKAVCKIEIDGRDIGNKLILQPNSSLELERFLDQGLDSGNRFKFIQKTKEVREHRGDRVDDSLIRVEVWFEKVCLPSPIYYAPIIQWPEWKNNINSTRFTNISCYSLSCSNCVSETTVDDGITVKGSLSNQKFQYGTTGILEDVSTVIVLKLQGYNTNSKLVEKPLTVSQKLICETCGKASRSDQTFCSRCGTYLS